MTAYLIEVLLSAVVTAATAVGLTLVLRAAPGLRGLDERGVKPIACDLCMSFWTTLTLSASAAALAHGHFLAWLPAFALAYYALQRIHAMPGDAPAEFGELPEQPPTTPPGGPGRGDEPTLP